MALNMGPAEPDTIDVYGVECDQPGTCHPDTNMEDLFVIRVISPFEFYCVHEADRLAPYVNTQNNIRFQDFFNREEYNRTKVKYNVHTTLYKCYALRDQRTGIWYRVKVLECDKDTQTVYVDYFDIGLLEHVPSSGLRNLPEQFTKDARPIWRCYLQDVVPAHEDNYWTLSDMVFFKTLVNHKVVHALPMSREEKGTNPDSREVLVGVGLALFQRTNDPMENVDSVNWLLVDTGHARSTGVAASSTNSLFLSGCVPQYGIDREGWSRSTVEEICIEKDDNRRHSLPPYPIANLSYNCLMPLTARNRFGWLRLSYVEGPECIFFQSEYMRPELEALERDLQKFMEEPLLVKPTFEVTPGLEVCCEVKGSPEAGSTWCRGVVYKNDPMKGTAQVILADYGSIIKVHHKWIHILPKEFSDVHSYAQRVHLSNIRPKKGLVWSPEAKEKFGDYINNLESDAPLYYAYRPWCNYNTSIDILWLDHISQGIQFDEEKRGWITAPQEFDDEDSLMQALRECPMLTSHFFSITVEIVYETPSEKEGFWSFINVYDELVRAGDGEVVVRNVN